MPNYDQSTFLAYRAQAAREVGPPKPPKMVALPGAKAAISHDHLLAHQDAGRCERDIVDRVNAKWSAAHADEAQEHAQWVAGPYSEAIEEMRRRQADKMAAEMRKQAFFDQILRERDGRNS